MKSIGDMREQCDANLNMKDPEPPKLTREVPLPLTDQVGDNMEKEDSKPETKANNESASKADETKPGDAKADAKDKKIQKSWYVCMVCYREMLGLDELYSHQYEEHAALDLRFGSLLEMRPGMKALCCSVPNAMGLLNVCGSPFPEQKGGCAGLGSTV